MRYEEIIGRFNVVRNNNDKCMCRCPAHNDRIASLSITYNRADKKTLMKCGAGCETNDVLECVGLSISDLFDETLEEKEKFNYKDGFKSYNDIIRYLKENPIGTDEISNIYKFKDENGKIVYLKIRTKEKKFLHVRLIENNLVWGLKGGEYYETFEGSNIFSSNIKNTKKILCKEQNKVLYNLDYVIKGIREDKTIYIVEGEKDADNLIKNDLIATTTSTGGGAGKDKWNDGYSQYFKGAKVVILPDNDKSGIEFAKQVEESILNYCYRVKTLIISDKEKGDISDWFEEGNHVAQLFEKLKEVSPKYAKWYNVSKNGKVTLNRNRLTPVSYTHLTLPTS